MNSFTVNYDVYFRLKDNHNYQFTKDGDKFKIEGYPTIVLADADNRILAEFSKSTTYENLEQFINENV